MMKEELKCAYVAPSIEVIEMEHEGVLAGSTDSVSVPGFGEGGSAYSRTHFPNAGVNYGTSDLEDMINDILTIKE